MRNFILLTLFSMLFLGAAINAEAESLDGKANLEQSIDNDIGEIQSYNFAKTDIGNVDFQHGTKSFVRLETPKILECEVIIVYSISNIRSMSILNLKEIENTYSSGVLTENKYNFKIYPNLSKSKSKKLLNYT